MIKSFDELAAETKEKIAGHDIPKMGIIYPRGGKCVEAAVQAADSGFIQPVLFGPENEIKKNAAAKNLDISSFEIKNISSPDEAARKAIEAARNGEVRFLLKGSIATRDLVEILLQPESGFTSKGKIISHIGLVDSPKYHKLMFITDAVVNAESGANVKIGIARNAAALARKLGVESPKAALLAAVEAIYPAVPVTMEEAAIAKMSDRGQIKDVIIDGPLSFDVAINADVARSKGITTSKVAGDADIFVGPSMETANGVYKAMVMYAGVEAAGMIYGGEVPVASTFIVDPVANTVNSIILGAFLAIDRELEHI